MLTDTSFMEPQLQRIQARTPHQCTDADRSPLYPVELAIDQVRGIPQVGVVDHSFGAWPDIRPERRSIVIRCARPALWANRQGSNVRLVFSAG